MTQAIASMRDGHAFQARQFWRKALSLLEPNAAIVRVAFECGPKGYDDIWVDYASGRGYNDQRGIPMTRQHIQCKWHVSGGEYGYAQLTDPDFINASSKVGDTPRPNALAVLRLINRLELRWHVFLPPSPSVALTESVVPSRRRT